MAEEYGGDGAPDAASDFELFNSGGDDVAAPPTEGSEETPPSAGGESGKDQEGSSRDRSEEKKEGEAPPEEKDKPPVEEKKEGEEKKEETKDDKSKGPYDEAFNKHPALRRAFFRDRAFLEVFSSPEEAKEASERLQDFDALEESIMDGDPEHMFRSIARNAPDALPQLVDNLIPSLAKISGKLAAQATMPGVRMILRTALRDGQEARNENLVNAVGWLARYMKIDLNHEAPTPRLRGEDPEVRRLREQNQSMMESRGREFFDSAVASAHGTLDAETKKMIGNARLTDFEKKALVDTVRAEVIRQLDSDDSHNNRMDTLWKRVERAGFPMNQRSEVIHAFLAGARALHRAAFNKHMAEVMKGKEQETSSDGGAPPPGGGGRTSTPENRYDPKRIDFRKTTDEQLFADEITYRK